MSTWRGQMREADVVRVALMNEWKDKPITFVAYGGVGGARAIKHTQSQPSVRPPTSWRQSQTSRD